MKRITINAKEMKYRKEAEVTATAEEQKRKNKK